MILINKSLIKTFTLEPETIATVARMSVPPTGSQLNEYDNLIKSIKVGQSLGLGANNLSTKFDCLYIRAVHDSQAALLNWVSSLYDATGVSSPTFTTDRGYKSNGSSSYLNWNFNPSLHSSATSINAFACAYVVEDVTRGNKAAIGLHNTVGATLTLRIFPRTSTEATSLCITQGLGGGIVAIANTDMHGFYAVDRDTLGNVNGRKDTTTGINASSNNSYINANIFECASNDNGTAAFFLNATVAFTAWGKRDVINQPNLRTSVRDYLLLKGVTGI